MHCTLKQRGNLMPDDGRAAPVFITGSKIELKHFPECSHGVILPMRVTVLGKRLEINESPLPPCCASCLEPYLNTFSTRCVICESPVLSGQGVTPPLTENGIPRIVDGKYVFAHAGCAGPGTLEGHWGEGDIILLGDDGG